MNQATAETVQPTSDNAKIRFAVRSLPVEYGDGQTFYEFRVVMRVGGRAVGVDDGPPRIHKNRAECRRAGYARVRELQSHRLFVIDVTAKDIENGEARSCSNCAISQALWRNQERMGLEKYEYDFRIEPYGFAVNVRGVVLHNTRDWQIPDLVSGVRSMPDLVSEGKGKLFIESMYQWTCHWDDWADSQCMTLKEWREDHPGDCKPYKPSPCFFVLDLDALKPEEEAGKRQTAQATVSEGT